MVLVVPSANPPSPAATVLVLRDSSAGPQIFMVRRREGTAFMGGAYVFPGGRVDPPDYGVADAAWCDGVEDAAQALGDLPPGDSVAYHVAASRELFEEAGVLLARTAAGEFVSLAGPDEHARFLRYRSDVHSGGRALRHVLEQEELRLALDALAPYAHWVTPPLETRRFDTRFFAARVPPQQTPAHDEAETTHSVWIRPADAIAAAARRDLVLPPPTWMTLEELSPFGSVDEAMVWARRRSIRRREPAMVQENGRRMLMMPSDLSGEITCFVWTGDRWLPGPA